MKKNISKRNILISSGNSLQKADLLLACDMLVRHGYQIYATGGTCDYLKDNGIPSARVLFTNETENPVWRPPSSRRSATSILKKSR